MTAHYFVTGASGFIGKHLLPTLLETGAQVTALYRTPPARADERARVVLGTLENADSYTAALAGVTHVIHAAGDARFANGQHFYTINRDATRALVEAVKQAAPALQRFVFLSSFAAIDRTADDDCMRPVTEQSAPSPTTDYGKSKLEAELLVAASGVPYTILRPALVVGAGMRANSHCAVFARMAARNHPFSWLRWPAEFSVIGVDDVVSAVVHAAHSDATCSQTYMLCGETIALTTIFDATKKRRRLPLPLMQPVARALRRLLPFSLKGMLLPALCGDDSALRATGWQPKQTALQALAPVIRHAQGQADMQAAPPGVTVVTGAANGLGRALAERLAKMNRDLLLVDVDAAALDMCCLGYAKAVRVVCDLSDPAACAALIASPHWNDKPISELFLIAGIGTRGAFADVSLERQQRVIDINVVARMRLAHAAIPVMQAEQFGRIIIISSSSAFQPLPLMAVYAASNAALLSWGEALGAELGDEAIDVLTVCPGGMQTKFQSSAGVREVEGEKLQSPDDVAVIVLAALAKGTGTVHTAFRSFAMSMLARGLSRKMSVMLWHRMMEKMR
jgi:uncharacterized protein